MGDSEEDEEQEWTQSWASKFASGSMKGNSHHVSAKLIEQVQAAARERMTLFLTQFSLPKGKNDQGTLVLLTNSQKVVRSLLSFKLVTAEKWDAH